MSKSKGDIAEDKACKFLEERGFSIVERNFYSRFGEIDIIAHQDEVLHFIEVKSGLDYESAISNITPQKLSRIIKTSDIYIKKIDIKVDYMYDAVIITPQSIDLVENITI